MANMDQIVMDLDEVKTKVNTLEMQIRMLSPADMLEFKGKVLEALNAIDIDIKGVAIKMDKFSTDIQGIRDYINIVKSDSLLKIKEQEQKVNMLTLKVSIYAGIVTILLTGFLQLILPQFVK